MFSRKLLLLLLVVSLGLALLAGCPGGDDDDDSGDDSDDDSGADDPPAIDHTPLGDQPAGFGGFQVRATITDNSAVAAAQVIYSISGAAEVTLEMQDSGDNVWIGQIPDQAAGVQVSYRINATDDKAQSAATDNYTFNVLAAVEILADDGVAEDGLRAIAAGDSLLVGLPMPTYPVKPARVRVKVHVDPSDVGKSVSAVLFLDTAAAGPSGEPAYVSDPVKVTQADAWLDIDVASSGLQLDSGLLIVGVTLADGKTPFVGLDTSTAYTGLAWYGRSGGTYTNLGDMPFAHQPMLRAIVILPAGGAK